MTTNNSPELLLCNVNDCRKPIKHNDKYCSMHRARLTRTGRFDLKSSKEKLLERSEVSNKGCLEYKRYLNKNGYGRLRYKGKKILAHRLSYELYVGMIPTGMLVCHKCDNPTCINPDHLFLGTNNDNVQDSIMKGRTNPMLRAKIRWEKCPTYREK